MVMANKTMEIILEKAGPGNLIAEEKKMKPEGDEDHDRTQINKEGDQVSVKPDESSSKPSSSSSSIAKDLESIKQQEDQLIRSTKAEMGEAREENERLKHLLSKILKDYQSLQMQLYVLQQKSSTDLSTKRISANQEKEESELVLNLGRSNTTSSETQKEEKKSSSFSEGKWIGSLSLGLDCKFEPDSSVLTMKNPNADDSLEELSKEEELTETWPPGQVLKRVRNADDHEVLQKIQTKKARVSIRTRCDTPTMNDGCQWRKYGQKIAKGNPCPRAYYRCTLSPNCPVRKQVQRCVEDMSILITTYEGNHNHPLPPSATALASTTSAAVSMLQSRSTTSQPGLRTSISAPASISDSNALNFTLSQSQRSPGQFYNFQNTSISTSNINSHPTITLDLTAPPTATTASHFNRPTTVYSPTCLNFPSSSLEPNSALQTSWKNPGFLSQTRSQTGSHFNHLPYMQRNDQQSLTETIAAATKVIKTNPSFRSALEAAITSFVGNSSSVGGPESLLTFNTSYTSSNNNGGIGCGSSYFSKSPSMSSQHQEGTLVLFPPPLPFSSSKSGSGSPANSSRDHFQ